MYNGKLVDFSVHQNPMNRRHETEDCPQYEKHKAGFEIFRRLKLWDSLKNLGRNE